MTTHVDAPPASDRAPRPSATGGGEDPAAAGPAPVLVLWHTCAALVWVGLYSLYAKVWIEPNEVRGNLLVWAQPVADGTAAAPFQYRVWVPNYLVWAHETLGWPVGFAQLVADAALLAIGVGCLHAALRRIGLELWVLPAATYGSLLGIGILWWGKPETIAAFAAVSLAVAAVVTDHRLRSLALVVSAAMLVGTRTDVLVALGVALVARWWWAGRSRLDLRDGVALAGAGVVATLAWKLQYPDAAYDPGTGVVQIAHNLHPAVWLTALAFLLPALGPYLLWRREPGIRRAVAADRAAIVPLLALVAVLVGSVAVIGRLEEVRLLFPLAGPLMILGALGWRALLPSLRAASSDVVSDARP